MAEQNPNFSQPQSEQEWREIMLGVNLNANFPDAINAAMTQQPVHPHEIRRDDNSLAIIRSELERHNMADLSPLAAPDFFALQDFSPEEWQDVHAARDPLLKLWSTAYIHSKERWYQAFTNRNNAAYITELQRQEEAAKIHSLPLIHTTSFDGLMVAIDYGAFLSNRRIHDAGTDVTSGIAQTHLEDRRLGLDKFVFASFGRPANVRPTSISVVLEPEAMLVPGAFLTERDIMDAITADGDLNYRGYMTDMVLAEDFYKVAQTKLSNCRSMRSYYLGPGLGIDYHKLKLQDFIAGSNSNPDQFGNAHFSTWEVKIPDELPTRHIRKILFTNPAEQAAFVQQHGDRFACEVVSPADLTVNPQPHDSQATSERANRNMHLFGSQDRYEREIVRLRAEDYARRQQVIANEGGAKAYMLLQHPNPAAPDAEYYDPTWYAASRKMYDTADTAAAAAHRDYDPGGQYYNQVQMGYEVWVDDGRGGGRYTYPRYREVLATEPTIDLATVRHVGNTAIITQLEKIQLDQQ